MKITKYKKIKNKYKVYIDNDEIDLYENIILKYNLLLKKEITEIELKNIKNDNEKEEIYEKALSYINIKMRSKKEIKKYLQKKNYSEEDISNTINKLEKSGFLNDEQYTKSFIMDKINLSNDGPNKIKYLLINEGIDEDLINKYIDELDKEEIQKKLNRLIDKKISTIKNCSGNVLKYKITSYFINLGYDKYMIEDILSYKKTNNNGEKEYYKLYNKYSKKYEGEKLESIIRQKLYQKGFDLNEIKENI